ncbi:MAG: ethylbenzene dehydrogenase-related protein [Desulfobacterales bacterium]|nr:ethylbenzene dehydrogenase-related protein [Desulfobacterales bacterium]
MLFSNCGLQSKMKKKNTLWQETMFILLLISIAPAVALGDHPGSATLLSAVKTGETITVDGIANELSWQKALPLDIQILDGTIGRATVAMKALYDDENLYLQMRWQDRKADVAVHQWIFDDTVKRWLPGTMLDPLNRLITFNEDRFSIKWNIDDSVNGFNIAGCAVLCHGDRMHTNYPHEKVDIWDWKASRTNPLNYADDMWLGDNVGDGFDKEARRAARHGDGRDESAGMPGMGGSYSKNLRLVRSGPDEIPAPRYWKPGAAGKDALYITQEEIRNGNAVEIKDHLSIDRKTPIPGYILFRPIGSGGDIDAKGLWENGVWTLELKRKLQTGNPDDVQFDIRKLYRFGISVHDNSDGFDGYSLGHSFDLGARTLEFGGTGSEQVVTMSLVQDYLLTGMTYAERKADGLAHSQIGLALTVFNEVQKAIADLDPKRFIDIKSSFITAKRIPSVEHIQTLLNRINAAVLLLQGKLAPSRATWSMRFFSWWGAVQAYVFILLGLLALIPISRSAQMIKKDEFRVMGGFLLLIMSMIFLESLGRIGMIARIRALQNLSFMTSEYASFAWALIVLLSLFMARKGFLELDTLIAALQQAHDLLESRVEERTAALAKANEEMRLQIQKRQRIEAALRESEMRLHDLSSHLLTAQETERRRISLELHDELGQSLAVLKLQVRSIEQELPDGQLPQKQECVKILSYIDQIIENVRRVSRDLSPSILEDLGLTAALRWLTEDFAQHFNIDVSFDIPDIDILFSAGAQIMLYRTFQEAFTNIGKHSGAGCVDVRIERSGDRVLFYIEDDGRGFDIHQVKNRGPSEKGMGLLAMDERARLLGGSLKIDTAVGQGTRISLDVPVVQGGN